MPSALLLCMVSVIPKRSTRQVQKEVRAMKAAGKKINTSPATARKFLLKNGFITKGNKLSAQYR